MTNSLIEALQLNKKGVISLMGAGGKTSLMFLLAKKLSQSKKRVLTTTTTKIFMPKPDLSPDTIIEDNVDELIKKTRYNIRHFRHFSAGRKHDPVSGKLKGFEPNIIDQLWQAKIFDWIIVEADGARQKPLKSSNLHEPAIPKETTHLILVTGLDALGKTLDDHYVHRPQIFSDNTGLGMGKTIDAQSIASSIGFEIKKAKSLCCSSLNFILLNKADTSSRLASGEKIAKILKPDKNIEKIIIASLKDNIAVKNIA
ncbi:MAG: selenium cofactor biosynthesis protein YqeC [Deltaproteobacteria bacterium]|jgi:probable selenium-dependent hydroxylase accessory protein YqeC|nr:selenium cofactor biosynthesis protein YqeC [Deltaproteobacteria bacterium]